MDPLESFTSHADIAGIMCHPDVSHALKLNMHLKCNVCICISMHTYINIIYILYHIIMIDKHIYIYIYIYVLVVSKNVGTGCHVFCASVNRISFNTLVLDDI